MGLNYNNLNTTILNNSNLNTTVLNISEVLSIKLSEKNPDKKRTKRKKYKNKISILL